MHRNRLGARLLAPLAIGALALAACSAPSSTSSSPSTETTASAGSTASGAKWCAGTKLVYFQGGDADAFASILGKGAAAAAADTGADVEIIQSGWDFTKMVEQFRQAIASKPDGISFMGHAGDPAIEPLAEQAKQAGIFVDYSNVPPKATIEKFGGGFVGANLKLMGQSLAKKAMADFGLVAGDQVIVIGNFGTPGREDREVGVSEEFEAAGIKVDRVKEADGSAGDPNLLTPTVVAELAKFPNAKLLVLSGGQILGGAPLYLKAAGKEPGSIKVAGFDLGKSVMDAFKQGYVQLTADQEPFKQGYLPIVSLCMQAKYGLSPLTVDTSSGFVTSDNYTDIVPLTEEGIR